MKHGKIKIFTGTGRGKTPAALGLALQTAAEGGQVTIIQFLKGRGLGESEFVKRLEPEIKLFRFEKAEDCFDDLSEEEKKEAIMNIKNGLNFARKVLSTGECDLLVLDEVLGLVDNEKDPVKIERQLRAILPPEKSNLFCHRLVLHGRAVCTARKTFCENCCCAPFCKSLNR